MWRRVVAAHICCILAILAGVAVGLAIGWLLVETPYGLAGLAALVILYYLVKAIRQDRLEKMRRQRLEVWWRRDYEALCRGEVFTDPVVTEDFIGEFSGKWEPR